MKPNIPCLMTALFLLLTLSGCVNEDVDGATHTFRYDLWVPLSAIAAGIVAAPAGWFLRRVSARVGWSLLIISPMALLLFAPGLFLEQSVVDGTSYVTRSGIWGLTNNHRVDFEGLQRVRITREERIGRRGSRKTSYFLQCETSSGSTKIPTNNDVSRAAAACFLKKVTERGIPVKDET